METSTPVQSYYKNELAAMFKVSIVTFRRWLRMAGIYDEAMKKNKLLTPLQVALIFNKLGEP